MKIMVFLRSVPDAIEELPLVDGQLDRDDVALKLNEFDDHALEQAVLLKEEYGCEVVAVAMKSAGDKLLQTAIARGADRAVQITSDIPDNATSRMIAPAIAEAMTTIEADALFTGMQSPEDMTGQLVPYLSATLDQPASSGVINASLVGGKLVIEQELGGGQTVTLQIATPAVVGIQTAAQPPRYVSGSRLRQVIQFAEIEPIEISTPLAVDGATIAKLFEPETTGGVKMLSDEPDEAAEQILEILREKGLME